MSEIVYWSDIGQPDNFPAADECPPEMLHKLAITLMRENDTLRRALQKALMCGLPPHDISGQKMWQEAREALGHKSEEVPGGDD